MWASNEYGISNEILVPLYDGKIVTEATTLDRSDKYAQIIYFMLVDRFRDGNKENNRPMNRPDVHPKADYHGGDLAGIKQVIDENYFNKLGANTLWLSPLNQNPFEPYGYNALANTKFAGYHGYWPISSSQVDCRFGSNDELKELVADAHDHQINILLDYVANHVHQDHPLYQRHPEYATPLYLPDGRMNTELWDEHRLTTWFDVFMPTLDMGNPVVVDIMVDSAVYWLKEFGVDGFRHDACKHVNEEYWRELTHRMKLTRPEGNFYQIGESYGSPELMASYVNSGMLDGQFDFNVFDEATSAFNGVSGGTMQRLSNVLNSSLKVYGAHNLMGYVSGNHDKPRFMALASGDIKVGEDGEVLTLNFKFVAAEEDDVAEIEEIGVKARHELNLAAEQVNDNKFTVTAGDIEDGAVTITATANEGAELVSDTNAEGDKGTWLGIAITLEDLTDVYYSKDNKDFVVLPEAEEVAENTFVVYVS